MAELSARVCTFLFFYMFNLYPSLGLFSRCFCFVFFFLCVCFFFCCCYVLFFRKKICSRFMEIVSRPRRQFASNAKAYFLGKGRKYFKILSGGILTSIKALILHTVFASTSPLMRPFNLTFTTPWANSADGELVICFLLLLLLLLFCFVFSLRKQGFDMSCKLSQYWREFV